MESVKALICDKTSSKIKFNQLLFEAIDETLASLGAPVKNMLYFQLENSFDIPKDEIPDQLPEFTNILHKIFGLGASRLEMKFLKNLELKVKGCFEGIECELTLSDWIVRAEEISFADYVDCIRKNYCNIQ